MGQFAFDPEEALECSHSEIHRQSHRGTAWTGQFKRRFRGKKCTPLRLNRMQNAWRLGDARGIGDGVPQSLKTVPFSSFKIYYGFDQFFADFDKRKNGAQAKIVNLM